MYYSKSKSSGISEASIIKYLKVLEKYNLSTHNLILAKGEDIFFEQYWKPFDENFMHRMYSVSKSFVSIAIGFLEQDGLIALDDSIEKYFPDEFIEQSDINMKKQTIRHMLMMCTAKEDRYWFNDKPTDRVKYYFENDKPFSREPGLIFQYDSSGSFVLCALVERITKMKFMDYLRLKLFDKIGVSKDAYCLECPGGHSWGDSGVLCTPRDLFKVARFVMNEGKWNGEQILNAEYLREATSNLVSSDEFGRIECESQGYGYLIWRTYNNSFFFNGMGCQFAVCVPDKDMIMIYNGDNQGNPLATEIIIGTFFDLIVNSDTVDKADNTLENYCDSLELASLRGKKYSSFSDNINGAIYILDSNPMGIEKISVEFEGEKGKLKYTNQQGDKEIVFGLCKNEYCKFPQEGYSDKVGSLYAPGNLYDCAASAIWAEPQKLMIKVQIIDKYFGNLNITLGFVDDKISIRMEKFAEDFLKEYQGFATGVKTL